MSILGLPPFDSVRLVDWVKVAMAFVTLCIVVGLSAYVVTVVGKSVVSTDAATVRMEALLQEIREVRAKAESNESKVDQVKQNTDKAAAAAQKTAAKTRRLEKVLKPILDNPALVPALVPVLVPTPSPMHYETPKPRPGGLWGIFSR